MSQPYICDGCGEHRDDHDSPCFEHPDFEHVICEECFNILEQEADEAKREREKLEHAQMMDRRAKALIG